MTLVNLVVFLRSLIRTRTDLAAENLALRQQLAILYRQSKRPRLRKRDRVFWVWFSRPFRNWRSILVIVEPDTVIRWHRQGFRLYWRWKSRAKKPSRPQIWREIRDLVRQMCRENPTWGAPRILESYFAYYHESRTHLSLQRNSPVPRDIEPPERGKVIAIPQVGGLHHRYRRAA